MTHSVVAVFAGGGTGGHLYPALALARSLTELRSDVHPLFIGSERGLERRVLPEVGMDHLLLSIEGFQRGAIWTNLLVLHRLAGALMRVAEVFQQVRPDLVVVTGGYAGGPAGLVAALTRTRLVLQEQNSVPGITTRVLSVFARQIHLAFPEAVDRLPPPARKRAQVTGNPVRTLPRNPASEARAEFGLDPDGPVVLVVGGSQGAEALNEAVLEAVQGVVSGAFLRPEGLQILWSTGPMHLPGVHARLRKLGSPGWVRPEGYIADMPLALSAADLAISRAGAMMTSEFLAWGIPSILVPLPTAAAGHQTHNAKALDDAGAALHLPQGELSGEALWGQVDRLFRSPDVLREIGRAALRRGRPQAAHEISKALAALLPPARAVEPGSGSRAFTRGRGAR